MKSLMAVIQHTCFSIWREKWPYLVFPLYLFCFLLSHLLGSFSIGRDSVVTLDFGLVFIQFIGVITTLYMVHMNWSKELEGASAAFYLTRPISRNTYVIGRFLGMGAVMAFVVFGGGLLLMILSLLLGTAGNSSVLVACYGIFLTNLVLLSVGLVTNNLSSPILGLMVSLLFFIAATLSSSAVDYLETRETMSKALGREDSGGGGYRLLATFVQIFIPQLDRLNFKELVVLEGVQPLVDIPFFHLTVYTLMFVTIFIAWGLHIFEKREFT